MQKAKRSTKLTQENDVLNETKIPFIQKNDKVIKFVKGWSGDQTYLITRNENQFFLKIITKHSCNFDNFNIYNLLNINTPKLIECGNLELGKYYITQAISATDFGDIINNFSKDFIYNSAKELGQQQRTLAEKIEIRVSTDNDRAKLFKHYDEILSKFFDNLMANKENLESKYLNTELYKKVLFDINQAKTFFQGEYVYYCHDDVMPNNFMIDCSNKFWTIDIEGSKTDFFTKKLRGYIQHMFHKKEKQKLITFFNGFINGFFKETIPQNLPYQIAYIYLVDMIDICNSPLEKSNYKEFQKRADMLIESYNKKEDIFLQCKNLIQKWRC